MEDTFVNKRTTTIRIDLQEDLQVVKDAFGMQLFDLKLDDGHDIPLDVVVWALVNDGYLKIFFRSKKPRRDKYTIVCKFMEYSGMEHMYTVTFKRQL